MHTTSYLTTNHASILNCFELLPVICWESETLTYPTVIVALLGVTLFEFLHDFGAIKLEFQGYHMAMLV